MKKICNGQYVEMSEEEVAAWEQAQQEIPNESSGGGGGITAYDALGSGIFVGELIEEVTLEEDAIYSISGDFKYLSAIVENVKCKSNTRLWYEVNGVQSVFDNIQSSYTGKGYIACKANDYVQVGYSGSGTWTNPMAKKMSNKIVTGNIKNVSISLGNSPNTIPLLEGTKITVYGIRA